jgi:hypothetical protein
MHRLEMFTSLQKSILTVQRDVVLAVRTCVMLPTGQPESDLDSFWSVFEFVIGHGVLFFVVSFALGQSISVDSLLHQRVQPERTLTTFNRMVSAYLRPYGRHSGQPDATTGHAVPYVPGLLLRSSAVLQWCAVAQYRDCHCQSAPSTLMRILVFPCKTGMMASLRSFLRLSSTLNALG